MTVLLRVLVLAVLLGGSFVGWKACQKSRIAFTAEERALIDDVVELYTIRITRSSDAGRAQAMLDSLSLRVAPADLDRRIEQLTLDPARATRLLQAVHDSLLARREAFVDEDAQGSPPVPRPGLEAPTDG